MSKHILETGQRQCFGTNGEIIACEGSGQEVERQYHDGAVRPRMEQLDHNLVMDRATGLIWPQSGGLLEFPVNWEEALQWVAELNSHAFSGRTDWRLPNRREMRSLIDHSKRRPALVQREFFDQVATDWYWTSTTSSMATDYAWYLHLDGGRMFYGRKNEYHWVWPVCSGSENIISTGQNRTFSNIPGQDDGQQSGISWPDQRFIEVDGGIKDLLTGLIWMKRASLTDDVSSWQEAINIVQKFRQKTGRNYRMPTINEMESLVDASQHSPALPLNHPFTQTREAYWTTTTSGFETDWSYVLYLHKGAVGVGFKANRDFHVWPVLDEWKR